jgi:hypothetical protein
MFDHVNGKRQLERHLSWRPPCCNGPAPNLFRVLPKRTSILLAIDSLRSQQSRDAQRISTIPSRLPSRRILLHLSSKSERGNY